ncbi:dephospho-CoA kinase [Acidovorax sp. RAC01]|uniref:dephospho-CoA kinase n=1 Tax=Acidovorax sp. RAC01 TaxID=1842533 RepID=UPI00083E910E|nr:dephospho-CoA kinase [Acidovorax sp. RAC01]AOG25341.1 dephospho-CoA kinase [Acidovorax sp. RAC01]
MEAIEVGLTGGIGSGKSTVAQLLAKHGAGIVDADQIARDTTAPGGAAMGAIRSAFGPAFIDATGALDRARMRELVFDRPEARAELEAIVHPLVGMQCQIQARQAAARGCPLIIFDVPLLAETGHWANRLDAVMVVDCDTQTQIERVVQRSGLAPETVEKIITSQATRRARLGAADIVIFNGCHRSLAQLSNDVSDVAALFGL